MYVRDISSLPCSYQFTGIFQFNYINQGNVEKFFTPGFSVLVSLGVSSLLNPNEMQSSFERQSIAKVDYLAILFFSARFYYAYIHTAFTAERSRKK